MLWPFVLREEESSLFLTQYDEWEKETPNRWNTGISSYGLGASSD